jgi:hypothetical protein
MSEEEELGDYLAAEAVAAALKEGDFGAFADLANGSQSCEREGSQSLARNKLGSAAR